MRARTAPRYVIPTLLGLWLLAGGVVSASSLPDPVVDNQYPLRMVGAGELRWLGLPIYDASLWTSSGRHAGFTAGDTVALSLWYRRSFTRDQLLDHAWPFGVAVTPNAVDAYVHYLRDKLGDAGAMIRTVRGVGYRLSDG